MIVTPLVLLSLIVWGTLVGLDLVSVAQTMIARPFVRMYFTCSEL